MDGIYESKIFKNYFSDSREHFIGGNLSASYAPNEETYPEKYHGFVKELNELFDEYSVNDNILYPQVTKSYIGIM